MSVFITVNVKVEVEGDVNVDVKLNAEELDAEEGIKVDVTQTLQEHLLTDNYECLQTTQAIADLHRNKQQLKQYIANEGGTLSQAELEYFQRSYQLHHRVPMFYSMPKVHKTPYST